MEPTQTTLVDTGSFQTIQGCSQQGTMVSIQVPIYQFVADPTEYSSPIDRRPFHVIIDRHIRSNFPHMQRLLVGSRQVRMLALADEVVVPRRYEADPRQVYVVDTTPPGTLMAAATTTRAATTATTVPAS
ncbi:hypothetical protein DFQ26_008195, partial [Actinomortierella ambigua]